MCSTPWVLCAFVLMLTVVGCGGVKESGTATLNYVFVVGRGGGGQEGELLEGVQLCETDTDNSTLSDAHGQATLELPVGPDVSWTVQKDGFGARLYPIARFEGASFVGEGLATEEVLAQRYEQVNSRYPMLFTGTINVQVVRGAEPLVGATFDLVDATGDPYYMTEEKGWSAELSATTSPTGSGGFTEVSPGVHRIRLGGTAQRCRAGWAWADEDENTIRLPVREGFITTASAVCPVTP